MPSAVKLAHFVKHDFGSESSWRFVPERNQKRVVNYNPLILQTWGGNINIMPVTSTHALVEYITKSDQKKLDDVM
ncbi:MAG: hypothetical protein MHMPM18_001158 [Marteilia pararefringens]